MTERQFFTQLAVMLCFLCALVVCFELMPSVAQHRSFSWGLVVVFSFLTLAVFKFGSVVAKQANKSAFLSFSLGLIGLKMMLGVGLVFAYHKLFAPSNTFFLVPFFVVYFTFSFFEYHCLMKLGNTK